MSNSAAIIIDVLIGLFFLTSLLLGDYYSIHVSVPMVLLGFHALKMYQLKDSIELIFLLIFSSTYPLFWLLSISLGVDIHYLSWNVDNSFVAQAFSAQGIFLCAMFVGMRNLAPATIAGYQRLNSTTVFWTCISAMLICLAIAVRSVEGNILEQSYNYELSSSSILFEYVLILIIIGYVYSGQSRLHKYALIAVSMLFVLAPLYAGKRLPASMVAFSILLLFWRPKNLRQVVIIFLSGFMVLSVLALFRVGDSGRSLIQILLNIGDQGAMRNNQGGVIYSSAAYMKLIQEDIFDWAFGIRSMLNTALSIFLPSSMVDQAAYINLAAMNHIPIPGNGGMPGVGFYVWGRMPGVIGAGLLFGWLMASSRRNYLSAVYVTFLLFTFPRWMAYNVNIMFKAGVLLILGYLLVRLVVRALRRDSKIPVPPGRTVPFGVR